MIFIFWKLRYKEDGFGIKTTFKWMFIIWLFFAPGAVGIYVLQGLTDPKSYVTIIRVLVITVYMNANIAVALDFPVYQSFQTSSHRAMSVILKDMEAKKQLDEVLQLAARRSLPNSHSRIDTTLQLGSLDSPMCAPELFSTKTLSLGLGQIVLNPLYAAQMKSFAKHLIGEFNVEGLLFFFRVENFRDVEISLDATAPARDTINIESTTVSAADIEAKQTHESLEWTTLRAKRDMAEHGDQDGKEFADHDVAVAGKALAIYFEFLDSNSATQVCTSS